MRKRDGVNDGENRVAIVARKTEDECNKANSIRHKVERSPLCATE